MTTVRRISNAEWRRIFGANPEETHKKIVRNKVNMSIQRLKKINR